MIILNWILNHSQILSTTIMIVGFSFQKILYIINFLKIHMFFFAKYLISIICSVSPLYSTRSTYVITYSRIFSKKSLFMLSSLFWFKGHSTYDTHVKNVHYETKRGAILINFALSTTASYFSLFCLINVVTVINYHNRGTEERTIGFTSSLEFIK